MNEKKTDNDEKNKKGKKDEKGTDAKQEQTTEVSQTPKVTKIKVGVIDDSEFSRKSMISILEAGGFEIGGEAGSVKDALNIVQNSPCDVYIIDIVMPETSGLELAKLINKQKADAYIIMVSSLRMENMIIESISLGAVDYLQKPFEAEDLLRAVSKLSHQILSGVERM